MKNLPFITLGFAIAIAGCKTQPRYPVPSDSIGAAEIPGMSNIRLFADQTDPTIMSKFGELISGMDFSGGSDCGLRSVFGSSAGGNQES